MINILESACGYFHRMRFLTLATNALLLVASGCQPSPTAPPAPKAAAPAVVATAIAEDKPEPQKSEMPSTPARATDDAAVELKEMDWAGVQEIVAANKGKVVVIDIWSTSCEPCLREFPHLVALQARHPQDVVCISFDCDYAGIKNKPVVYYRERVLKNLTSQKATSLINGMCTTAADELFMQLDIDSIPAVYVYDRSGKVAKRFDNRTPASETEEGISYEKQIDPLVADLVKAENK